MSRVGKQPITVPDGIQIEKKDDTIVVKGTKAELSEKVHPDMNVIIEPGLVRVERPSDNRQHRSLHGLFGRSVHLAASPPVSSGSPQRSLPAPAGRNTTLYPGHPSILSLDPPAPRSCQE